MVKGKYGEKKEKEKLLLIKGKKMHNKGALLFTITVLHFKKRQFFFILNIWFLFVKICI